MNDLLTRVKRLWQPTDALCCQNLLREVIATVEAEAAIAAPMEGEAELREQLADLRRKLGELADTTREVMKLIDDGYLIRDISKDHEKDWAIRQFKAVALLAKWAKQTELAEALLPPTAGKGGPDGR